MGGPRLRDMPIGVLRKMVRAPMSSIAYVNSRYSVQVSFVETAIGKVCHLWIRQHDGEMPRAWSDLQRIKNAIAGPECTAVEVFPPESELVDSANMAHLWVYPPGWVMPFRLQP